jgi:biopolymer transport protein ExbB
MTVSSSFPDSRIESEVKSRQVFVGEPTFQRVEARLKPGPIVRRGGLAFFLLFVAAGADAPAESGTGFVNLPLQVGWNVDRALAWYVQTPPLERISWGGLALCAVLAACSLLDRSVRLQRRRVLPSQIVGRLLDRLRDGKLDRAMGLDLCELNPSPAARIARSAIDRWAQSMADLERAVVLVSRVETGRLWRSIGILRRIAVMAPLLGLLGSLASFGRILESATRPPGPMFGASLHPLMAGVALAIVALAAYDGLVGHVEDLVDELDSLSAATVDALIMITPAEKRAGYRLGRPTDPSGPMFSVPTPHHLRTEGNVPTVRANDGPGRGE